MDDIKKILSQMNSVLKTEITGIKKLKGKKLKIFIDVFNLDEDIILYYNTYNMLLVDPILDETLKSYHKKDSLVISIEIPQYHCNVWVYQYFGNQIFESYLEDTKPIS